MKKVLAILLAACLALSLAACGGSRFFRACFHSAGYLWLRAGFRACGGRRLHRRFLLHVQRHIYFHGPHRVGRGVG